MNSQAQPVTDSEDTRIASQESFSSSVINELEARQDPLPSVDEVALPDSICNICRHKADLIAHHVIPGTGGDSQVYDSKALGLFVAEGFDVQSAQNGIFGKYNMAQCRRD